VVLASAIEPGAAQAAAGDRGNLAALRRGEAPARAQRRDDVDPGAVLQAHSAGSLQTLLSSLALGGLECRLNL